MIMDEDCFKKIAEEVEKEWHMGGLVASMYYDFAKEVAQRYIAMKYGGSPSAPSKKKTDEISECKSHIFATGHRII